MIKKVIFIILLQLLAGFPPKCMVTLGHTVLFTSLVLLTKVGFVR